MNAKDNEDKTALHDAAWYGHEDVVRVLVELGADLDAKDNEYKTALYSAADQGQEDVVRF